MRQGVIAPPQHHADTCYSLTELGALAIELQAAEGLDLDQALDAAAEQLDQLLRYYPMVWDGCAASAGDWEAFAGAVPF